MRSNLRRLAIASIFISALACPLILNAQYVYVNDNNSSSGANTVTGYAALPGPILALLTSSPFATFGTGAAAFPSPLQQVAISYSSSQNCLFASDPLPSSPSPTGDVAEFSLNPTSGTLTYVGSVADPSNPGGFANKLIPIAIDRRLGFPYFFAAFTGENKILFYKVNPSTCQLFWASSTAAVGLTGSPVRAMAVTKSGPHVLVVTYGDGSIQSFKIGGGTLTPMAIFNSTGFTNQTGRPSGVDIIKNGKFAVFGDNQAGFAEVEVAPILLSGNLGPTIDYGGPATASGINLGPGLDSQNVWISPGQVSGNFYLFITNNSSGQVTTARISPAGVVNNAVACTGVFTNPTTLAPAAWSVPAGLHTVKATGNGAGLVVAEYGSPSSVALLKIQGPTGCTVEVPGSPYTDTNSNLGLLSIDVFPSRPY